MSCLFVGHIFQEGTIWQGTMDADFKIDQRLVQTLFWILYIIRHWHISLYRLCTSINVHGVLLNLIKLIPWSKYARPRPPRSKWAKQARMFDCRDLNKTRKYFHDSNTFWSWPIYRPLAHWQSFAHRTSKFPMGKRFSHGQATFDKASRKGKHKRFFFGKSYKKGHFDVPLHCYRLCRHVTSQWRCTEVDAT